MSFCDFFFYAFPKSSLYEILLAIRNWKAARCQRVIFDPFFEKLAVREFSSQPRAKLRDIYLDAWIMDFYFGAFSGRFTRCARSKRAHLEVRRRVISESLWVITFYGFDETLGDRRIFFSRAGFVWLHQLIFNYCDYIPVVKGLLFALMS